MDIETLADHCDVLLRIPGPEGVEARRKAMESMLAGLPRMPGLVRDGIDLGLLLQLPWPDQLMKFQQLCKVLADIYSTPEPMRDKQLRGDFARMGPDGVRRALLLASVGRRMAEQCFRDSGGEVK